jgi:hypothetical protein
MRQTKSFVVCVRDAGSRVIHATSLVQSLILEPGATGITA